MKPSTSLRIPSVRQLSTYMVFQKIFGANTVRKTISFGWVESIWIWMEWTQPPILLLPLLTTEYTPIRPSVEFLPICI